MKQIIIIFLLLTTSLLFAQSKIEFKNTVYDYGNIKEDGGLAETEFEFTNSGNQPLVLNNVKATCGCTTPSWTKEPVAPGKTGTIKVSYNPQNRPGAFSKNVNVYSNSQPSVAVLTIKGEVLPREQTLEENYPRVMGPLRWKSNYLSMGSMLNTENSTKELEFINTSETDARIGIHRAPENITVTFEPAVVKPGQTGIMKVNYDAAKKNAFGYISDRVYLMINDEKQNTYSVGVSVTLNEDFSSLTPEQLANAPIAEFGNKVYDFGTIKQGEKARNNFRLSNKGKTDLLIRNVKTSCGCTAVKHEDVVKPGYTIDLTVEFNSKGKRSRQNKSITVITNDPKNPTTTLRIMGNVEVAEDATK